MKKKLLYLSILTILLPASFSCAPHGTSTGDHVAYFYREEPKFQKLVEALQAEPVGQKRPGQFLFWKVFSNSTKKQLQQLGITHVHLYAGSQHLDLKTNWNATRPVYLCYRERGGLPSQEKPFTILHSLNSSWTLCTKALS